MDNNKLNLRKALQNKLAVARERLTRLNFTRHTMQGKADFVTQFCKSDQKSKMSIKSPLEDLNTKVQLQQEHVALLEKESEDFEDEFIRISDDFRQQELKLKALRKAFVQVKTPS